MTQLQISRTLAIVTLIAATGACTGVKEQLGMTKQSPDEFRVVSRAPLSIPPEFSLRPPQPGEPRPQEGTVQQQARTAVFRASDSQGPSLDEVMPEDGRSVGERSLLKAAGADRAESDIRTLVNRETRQVNEENQSFIDALVFWREDQPAGTIVDADAESRRLKENAALGRGVTAGETPTIERRKRALLEGLF